ncbi:two-component system response regulator [Leifsonia xyli subsp. cynodontis DSM 46306]|uniref:Uncharacterized protein n=1 Tax=Leifsonia xyli subsp. cynodontis DSM 46306 TaxID=1389489 RepID=U3P421_LEIXC|nr:two-component system response regulator [Leifsonia xyli subsp. cynodontis DSM 46306]
MAEVVAAQAALVRERADDLARFHPLPFADLDAIGRHRSVTAVAAHRTLTPAAIVTTGPVVASVPLDALGERIVGGEQQRLLPMGDDSERRRHIRLGHIVMGYVVGDDVAEPRDAVLLGEGDRDRVVETGEAGDVDIIDARELHRGQRLTGGLLDRSEKPALARGDEADRRPAASGAAGPADAMDIRFGVDGDVEVDDMADAVDIEPPRRHIRGDQNVELARFQLVDCALPLGLCDVAVDRRRRVATGPEPLRERLRLVLRADEDDHPLEVLDLEDASERVDLLRVRNDEIALRRVGRRRRPGLDGDLFGIVQVLLRDAADLRRHRRGEERDLLVIGRVGENRLHILGETHLQHLVGLIEHEVLERGEVERSLVEVIHDAAGRAHHDMHASTQRGELHPVALAAVHRQQMNAFQMRRIALERLRHLQRQLAGGGEHESLRALLRQIETGQNGKGEGGRLPRPGLGEPDHVPPLEQQRDRRGLDGGRRLVADVLQGGEHGPVQTEIGEGQCVGGSLRLAAPGSRHHHLSTVVPGRDGVRRVALG